MVVDGLIMAVIPRSFKIVQTDTASHHNRGRGADEHGIGMVVTLRLSCVPDVHCNKTGTHASRVLPGLIAAARQRRAYLIISNGNPGGQRTHEGQRGAGQHDPLKALHETLVDHLCQREAGSFRDG